MPSNFDFLKEEFPVLADFAVWQSDIVTQIPILV